MSLSTFRIEFIWSKSVGEDIFPCIRRTLWGRTRTNFMKSWKVFFNFDFYFQDQPGSIGSENEYSFFCCTVPTKNSLPFLIFDLSDHLWFTILINAYTVIITARKLFTPFSFHSIFDRIVFWADFVFEKFKLEICCCKHRLNRNWEYSTCFSFASIYLYKKNFAKDIRLLSTNVNLLVQFLIHVSRINSKRILCYIQFFLHCKTNYLFAVCASDNWV